VKKIGAWNQKVGHPWHRGFLLSDPILFLKNVIPIRSESCFGWNHTIRVQKVFKLVLWCTMGAIWWGTRETCPPTFSDGGHNMPCPPHIFSLGFVFGEVSKLKVMFVTFCVKSCSC